VNFDYTPKVQELRKKLSAFMDEHVYPNEHKWHQHARSERRWEPVPVIEELKPKARAAGLWNLWRPKTHGGALTSLEYAPLCEIMGRVHWAPELFNCSAPDTGNMETLLKYGTPEQVKQWCEPLLEGRIRSAFLMTEPGVASSDATNIQTRILREQAGSGDHYVINGTKWWSSGAGDPRCKIYIVMARPTPTTPRAQPAVDAAGASRHAGDQGAAPPAGVRLRRCAPRPHGDRAEGRARAGVQRAAGRGPRLRDRAGAPRAGKIHHCMRLIGQAEAALEKMCKRATGRVAFGRPVADQGVTRERIAEARIMIDAARYMVLNAAWKMDTVGNKAAKKEIAMIKVFAPNVACKVIDWAIQVHGGGGVSDDFGLAYAYAHARTLRFADGPDEVHRNQIAKMEIGEQTSIADALSKMKRA